MYLKLLYLYLCTYDATAALLPWNGSSDATTALVPWTGEGEEDSGVGRAFVDSGVSDFLLGVFVRESTRKVGSFAVFIHEY